MQLLAGINHVAVLTPDLDRLVRFYGRVFDARVELEMKEGSLRLALINVGTNSLLSAYQLATVEVPAADRPRFDRGRHDHIGFNAASEDAFRELRNRLLAIGATDGVVTDVGPAQLFCFTDPDGWEGEVLWMKPGVPWEHHKRPAHWEIVDID